jgi:hypothetical protein
MMSNRVNLPPHASPKYVRLHNTALAFIDAHTQDVRQSSRVDFDRIEATVAPDFQHKWGHNYAVSMNLRIQGTHSFTSFTKHLEAMLPNLESWETTIADVIVDEMKNTVMLRVSFWMVVKGAKDTIEHDLLWVLEMAEQGEKVKSSTEFIDAIAAARLKEIMMSGMTQYS